jgi:hypothetical protein
MLLDRLSGNSFFTNHIKYEEESGCCGAVCSSQKEKFYIGKQEIGDKMKEDIVYSYLRYFEMNLSSNLSDSEKELFDRMKEYFTSLKS